MSEQKTVSVGNVTFGNDLPFVLIAGPCQIESLEHSIEVAGRLKEITTKLGIPLIYKSSFDKANRTSVSGKRGLGLEKSLTVFDTVKKQFGCPVLTDVHAEYQCDEVASVVDILQIPAFLCRQTDLLIAAGKTGKAINIKKGQFLAPWDMQNVAEKVASTGNDRIILTDRGTSFGYNTLITDFRGFPIMAKTGYPVVLDATHSVQQPGGLGGASGGQREFVATLAKAAVAIGVAGLFMETHEAPERAPSDGPCMVRLSDMEALLGILKEMDVLGKKSREFILQ